MIESITISGEATYSGTPELMDRLSQLNYVFGANGTGKTTLSRVIGNCSAFPRCSITWKNGTPLEVMVYNREFVAKNYHQCDELPGIFTLGEKNAEIIKSIDKAKQELDELSRTRDQLNKSLQGDDGLGGKKNELAILEDGFKDVCWSQKKKHDAKLQGAFEGYRGNQEKFKEKILQESTSNSASLCKLQDLEARAVTVFGEAPALANSLPLLDSATISDYETDTILSKHVVGKTDIDIAALIIKLGNSDWVKAGRAYFASDDRICPFCQQEAPMSLETSLNEYFDEAFEKDTLRISELETNYKTEAARIQQRLAGLIATTHPFLDTVRLQEEKEILDAKVSLNLQRLATKKKEPSQSVALESLDNVLKAIKAILEDANSKVAAHNQTVKNLASEKTKLTAQVWRYLLDAELKDNLEAFKKKRVAAIAAISALQQKIKAQDGLIAAKKAEIAAFEKETTSIQPTIDGINRLLKSFGFRGFELAKSGNERCYKLIRADGTDAKETLSEGERTFVTFLYFYHLLKGSTSDSGTVANRVVVFDDPVSSLDSDILFIVGSLIKGLFDEVRTGKGQIKQVFVLTHNVYFHKEVTFNAKRQNVAMTEETFWTVRKSDHKSTIQRHDTNPIKTSYELLWAEVRNPNRTTLTIQNTLRRILENYFRILGGIDPDAICQKFEGKDRLICNSLFSWVNDGSHSAHDDLYVSIEASAVDGYLRVFREIFKRTDHLPHYRMMMGDAWQEEVEILPAEVVEPTSPL